MARGRVGGLDRVPPFVDPGIDTETVALARAPHELPHADGVRPAHRLARIAALDQREVSQVSGEPLLLEAGADHRLEPRAPAEEDLHALAAPALEVGQVVLDPRVGGVGADVDVPADALGIEGGHHGGIRRRRGEVVQRLRVGGGALVGQGFEVDDGHQRVVHGRRDRHRRGGGREMARARGQTDERDGHQQSLHAGVMWAAGLADG